MGTAISFVNSSEESRLSDVANLLSQKNAASGCDKSFGNQTFEFMVVDIVQSTCLSFFNIATSGFNCSIYLNKVRTKAKAITHYEF